MGSNVGISELINANRELTKLYSAGDGFEFNNVEKARILELVDSYKKLSEELAIEYKNISLEHSEQAKHAGELIIVNKEFVYQTELFKAYKDLARQYEEKAKLAEEMINLNKELQLVLQQNSDKDLFITTLAHDLRSPFCGLLGLSELLNENISNRVISEIELVANLINQSLHETFMLLEDILTWIKIQSGKMAFNPQRVDLRDEICKYMQETFSSYTLSKNITINCFDNESVFIIADVNMLKGIFRNLI